MVEKRNWGKEAAFPNDNQFSAWSEPGARCRDADRADGLAAPSYKTSDFNRLQYTLSALDKVVERMGGTALHHGTAGALAVVRMQATMV